MHDNIHHLKAEINLNHMHQFRFYLTENIMRLHQYCLQK
jgi:hypothetical protein